MVVEEEAAAEAAGPHQDPPHIVKGKRTKRQRPQSPIPFTITTQYSSSSGEGGNVSNCVNNDNNSNSSNGNGNGNGNSSSSSAEQVPREYATTQEDEYTARCLILLARGEGQHNNNNNNVFMKEASHHDQDYGVPEKFISKRYIEAPISGNGKAGMYVYECKTCGRTFPSFQALGGHRASHKKPKNMAAEEKKMMFLDISDEEEEMPFKTNNRNKINNNNVSSSLSLELVSHTHRGISGNNANNLQKSASFPRIHECSHCGAEFTSGQALGGHMRRHRGAPAAIANTTLSLGQSSAEIMDQDSDQEAEAKRIRNGTLTLDLNLPAPEPEDDHHQHHNKESKFGLASKQQQQRPQQKQPQEEKQPTLVLSTTTKLVDCHY